MGSQTLSMLVHGEAGVGKSWLGDTAPAPRLILDAEGRSKYLPSSPKVQWNPATEEPPAPGDWVTCTAQITNFELMSRVYQWLASGQHPFKSVVLDSLMEMQKRLIDSIVGAEALRTQDWGVVLRRLESLVRSYRDLVIQPENPVQCVVFTSGSKDDDGVRRPLLQGQLANTLPYYLDLVGYLYVSHDPSEQDTIERRLLVQPSPTAVAKDGTGRLQGPVLSSPNIEDIYNRLNGENPE